MLGFTRSLAREVGRLGITVNAVAPGFIDTDMTHGLTGEQRQQVMRRSALRRLASVDDVANAVEFLLGDKAAEYFRHGVDRRRRRDGVRIRNFRIDFMRQPRRSLPSRAGMTDDRRSPTSQ